MKSNKTHTIQNRRKREGKTNYRKRLKLLLSKRPRLVIRKSLRRITAQVIKYNEKGDKVIITATSDKLKDFGWEYNYANLPSAYLLGILVGKKAQEAGIKEAIADIGLSSPVPGSKMYAVIKGSVDAGLNIPYSESVLPKEDRLKGKHIEQYASKLSENPDSLNKRFSSYIKKNSDPHKISEKLQEIKKMIIGA
ncbi:50S ribosomal protein L18 [Candidatus Woesearchaeota archaeon]|nr:50S ribosomal protein L18 [Candidatus Woesearchaeota archaeon]